MILLIVSIGSLALIRYITFKYTKGKGAKRFGLIMAFVIAVVLSILGWQGTAPVYVIDKDYNISEMRLIGGIEYALDNGKVITEIPIRKVSIINNSDQAFFLEKVEYGAGDRIYSSQEVYDSDSNLVSSSNIGYDIFPYTAASFFLFLGQKKIDYFMNDEAPNEISSSLSGEVKYWLREPN
ncbi:MAG: hypothetical protein QNK23_01845 [Crocinitomicaceae bacterium]|nr:hypothetical protein [Crocinitomicaceae bacterium]